MLLVEDDERLSELVRSYLDGNGFDVSIENRGDRVLGRVQQERPDLVIPRPGLPGQSGFAVCKEMRAAHSTPILILTARNSDIDQVLGLELGADDFVISLSSLACSSRAFMRSCDGAGRRWFRNIASCVSAACPSTRRPVPFGWASRKSPCPSNEFDLLLRLASHPGEIQSRETLYLQLYRREYDGVDRTLDVRISHLRRKLGDTGEPERIKTVWGHGYLFVPGAW